MNKIGILTLGLKDNYGGILQTVALYSFLEKNGFQPKLIRKYPIQKKWKLLATKFFEVLPFQNYKNIRLSNIKFKKNTNFLNTNMPNQSGVFNYKFEIENYINNEEINSLIVGSDQVWRYAYINDSEYDTYFLNLNLSNKVKKIAYAASFGVSYWEAPEKINEIKKYLADFDAVSVREQSGLDICINDFMYKNPKLVLDPTLLVNKDLYDNFIFDNDKYHKDCVTYILDQSVQKEKVVNNIFKKLNVKTSNNLYDQSSYYSIEEWVTYIAKSNFVVTDSFHGMVFSIIFNKQFIVLLNEERGVDRFYSLCNQLGLTNRLIKANSDFSMDFNVIDYKEVNLKLEQLKKDSFDFIISALSG